MKYFLKKPFYLLLGLYITWLALSPLLTSAETKEVDGGVQKKSVLVQSSTPPPSALNPCLLTSVVCEYEKVYKENQTIYSYSSSVEETDSSPFVTASQQKVRKGIVANNCYEYGTLVKIKGQIYEVQDRMNKRYDCDSWDIWQETKQEALNWGKKTLTIEIIN